MPVWHQQLLKLMLTYSVLNPELQTKRNLNQNADIFFLHMAFESVFKMLAIWVKY